MTFEQYRMLSVGMTERAVIMEAGVPESYAPSGAWLYHRDDGTLVSLTIIDGRLIKVEP